MMLANLGWSILLVAVFLFILFWCRDMLWLVVLFPGGFGCIKIIVWSVCSRNT